MFHAPSGRCAFVPTISSRPSALPVTDTVVSYPPTPFHADQPPRREAAVGGHGDGERGEGARHAFPTRPRATRLQLPTAEDVRSRSDARVDPPLLEAAVGPTDDGGRRRADPARVVQGLAEGGTRR